MFARPALFFATAFSFLIFSAPGPARNRVPASVSVRKKTVAAAADKISSAERQIAQRWMRGLSLHDLVAQLVMVTSYGEALSSRSELYRKYAHQVRDLHVGGIIVVNRVANGTVRNAEPHAMATFLNRMQKLSRIPLLIGADFERGASMRVAGTVKYPHLMAYGAARDLQLTRALGLWTAREARALGVQWVFAPDADVNSNPDNPIINTRSFGENPLDVAAQVKAFIEGAHSDPANRVLVTVKHFPGHGDTDVDTHMGLAKLTADKARMEALELVPFKAAIQDNVDSVMTAHMAVPAVEPQEIPATISAKVLTGLLRTELNFPGLIVTDAMDMQGLARQVANGEASVRAIEAGVDMLLMPPNPEDTIRAVTNAVQSGRITRQRIEQSVMRVLAAKARVGLQRNKLVNLEEISDVLDSQEAAQEAQRAADKAVTLVKNESNVLPLRNPHKACWLILAESRSGQQGQALLEELRKHTRDTFAVRWDPQVPMVEMDAVLDKSNGCETYVLPSFVSAAAYRGNVALAGAFPQLIEKLQAGRTPVVIIAMGNPYLLRAFPKVNGYLATYSTAPSSEVAAVRALYGDIAITGKLPVTIPGLAKYGDGIQLSK